MVVKVPKKVCKPHEVRINRLCLDALVCLTRYVASFRGMVKEERAEEMSRKKQGRFASYHLT